ncbi:MAG: glycosyltransferase family 39 protein [Candidatus Solibacter sp.]
MIQFWKHRGFRLFAGVWLAYSVCPPFLSYDSYWTVATALQLMEHGTTQVDSLVASAPPQAEYGLECVPASGPAVVRSISAGCPDGHWYSNFPLGTAVLALPLLAVMKGAVLLAGRLVPHSGLFARAEVAAFFAGDLLRGRPLAELWCASFFGALTVWLQYRLARLFLSPRAAMCFALLFAFGTTQFSLASRNLYPHGLTLLLLSAALLVLLEARTQEAARPLPYAFAGLLLAASFAVRPSNAISCLVLAAYVAVHHRDRLLSFLVGAAPVAALFFGYQLLVRHSLIPLYITAPKNSNPFWEGLALNLVSPSRGLLIFTPLFVFSLAGMALALRRRWCAPLPAYLIAIVVLHTLLVTTIWPGHCYGPRYFADITHLLIFFLLPAILWWQASAAPARRALAAAFLALAGWGVFVHVHGSTSIAANQWSALPVNVDAARWRVWDWRDPQFLRGLR